ncbi:MAG: recombinase RecT [Cyanobacteria bacterium RUI128]|nr:recombinase RecT [Cyanobacteria bacterium RUI128]
MANLATVKAQVKAQENKPKLTIYQAINKSVDELGKALPKFMDAERLCRIALTTIRNNPKLAECTQASILGAIFQSAQLGLEPNIEGQAYIIPYTNSKKVKNEDGKTVWVKKTEAQFQIGYKGYIELFYRHGSAISIDMHTVYENDVFEYNYGTNRYLNHCPKLGDRGKAIGYYAIATLSNGGNVFKVMSRKECIEHGKKHSKTYITNKYNETTKRYEKCEPHFDENSPWVTDTDSMCKKTVLIQLAKLLPKSVELQKALAMDNTTKSQISEDMFNIPDETNWKDDNIS